MMKRKHIHPKLLLLLLLLSSCLTDKLIGQALSPTVITSAGGAFDSFNFQTSLSLGEAITPTFAGTGTYLTQGFQQPEAIPLSTGLDLAAEWNVRLFPNPFQEHFQVIVQSETALEDVLMEVVDALGKAHLLDCQARRLGENLHFTFDFGGMASGIYFLRITDPNSGIQRSFPIQKIPQ